MKQYKVWLITLSCLITPFIANYEAFCEPTTDEIAIHCILGEARGESFEGQAAVGEVLRKRGGTHGMYGCKAKFSISKETYATAKRAWEVSETSNYSKGGTHFESTDFPPPYWTEVMVETTRIGKHIFYKEK